MLSPELIDRILKAIDHTNRQDPNQLTVNGRTVGAAELYGLRMSDCLAHYCKSPSAALKIAARAQHIERWHIARSEYPMDRMGYHRWRTALGHHHAQKTAQILTEAGAELDFISQVMTLLRKENLKSDPDTQILEDVACLVFLTFYLEDFSQKHSEQKLLSIIAKTWRKMSDAGHQAALTIELPDPLSQLVKKALGPL